MSNFRCALILWATSASFTLPVHLPVNYHFVASGVAFDRVNLANDPIAVLEKIMYFFIHALELESIRTRPFLDQAPGRNSGFEP